MLEKRIEDLKWFIGVFSGSVAFLVAGLSVIVGFNLSSERASLRDFKDELRIEVRESLGTAALPSLKLLTLDRRPLHGSEIEAWVEANSKGIRQIRFRYVVLNEGKGRSGPLFTRIYSSDVPLSDPNTDDTDYKYSTFVDSPSFNPSILPGGVSMPYIMSLDVPTDFKLASEHALLVRFYYANGQTVDATFKARAKR